MWLLVLVEFRSPIGDHEYVTLTPEQLPANLSFNRKIHLYDRDTQIGIK